MALELAERQCRNRCLPQWTKRLFDMSRAQHACMTAILGDRMYFVTEDAALEFVNLKSKQYYHDPRFRDVYRRPWDDSYIDVRMQSMERYGLILILINGMHLWSLAPDIRDQDGPNYARLCSAPVAFSRSGTLHAAGHRLLVCEFGKTTKEWWQYDVDTNRWSQQTTSGQPVPRQGYAMTSTARNDCLFLFGGVSNHNALLNDLWMLNVEEARWYPFGTGPGPSPRHGAALIHAPCLNGLLLWGGTRNCMTYEEDCVVTWKYCVATRQWLEMEHASLDDALTHRDVMQLETKDPTKRQEQRQKELMDVSRHAPKLVDRRNTFVVIYEGQLLVSGGNRNGDYKGRLTEIWTLPLLNHVDVLTDLKYAERYRTGPAFVDERSWRSTLNVTTRNGRDVERALQTLIKCTYRFGTLHFREDDSGIPLFESESDKYDAFDDHTIDWTIEYDPKKDNEQPRDPNRATGAMLTALQACEVECLSFDGVDVWYNALWYNGASMASSALSKLRDLRLTDVSCVDGSFIHDFLTVCVGSPFTALEVLHVINLDMPFHESPRLAAKYEQAWTHFFEALATNHARSRLTELRLYAEDRRDVWIQMGSPCCIALTVWLHQAPKSLKILDLCQHPDAYRTMSSFVAALAPALLHNRSIHTLIVPWCGATACKNAMQYVLCKNRTLTTLRQTYETMGDTIVTRRLIRNFKTKHRVDTNWSYVAVWLSAMRSMPAWFGNSIVPLFDCIFRYATPYDGRFKASMGSFGDRNEYRGLLLDLCRDPTGDCELKLCKGRRIDLSKFSDTLYVKHVLQ